MNDKYNSRIEDVFIPYRNDINDSALAISEFDITNLVKRWYSGKPNYGLMIKFNKEVYDENISLFSFYSKSYDLENSTFNRPSLSITYRNQNGIEDYMTYTNQTFSDGRTFVNNLTGNLTAMFNLGNTIGGKMPINLSAIYNTNDVVIDNNYGYGIGVKLNFHETIKEIVIDGNNYLEYLDSDGTIHYFYYHEEQFRDEDGLNLTALLVNNNYVITDKDGNEYTYVKNGEVWYLSKIRNVNDYEIIISYDSLNRIEKLSNSDNDEINLYYENNQIRVVTANSSVVANYDDNKLMSIVSSEGVTSFNYNSYGIIEKIIDLNGLGYKYEYYESKPYKIKKVIQLGLNDAIGQSVEYEYGFCVTKVIDNKGNYYSYTFNERGNTIAITDLKDENELNSAYGRTFSYYDFENSLTQNFINNAMNKLNNEVLPVKYVKNLISNSSFESECSNRSTDCARTGSYSHKINVSSSLEFGISPAKYYTFSAYFKNTEKITLSSYVTGVYGTSYNEDIVIPSNLEFTRYDFTFYANDTRTIFGLLMSVDNDGVAYMDDIQLEEGQIANYYNMIENSDFSEGFDNWIVVCNEYEENDRIDDNKIITLSNGKTYAELIGGPDISTTLSQYNPVSGKKGDIYNLSFWYKNTGIVSSYIENYASVLINFNYPEDFEGYGEPWMDSLNYHATEWQYYSGVFVAEDDYDGLYVDILYLGNANTLSITNVVLSKDIEHDAMVYDYETGNMTSYRNFGGNTNEYKYDNANQIVSVSNPQGNATKFEYDNIETTKLIKNYTPSCIANEIIYDDNNNVVKNVIKNINPDGEILEGKYYFIRAKGTEKYLDISYSTNQIILKEKICNQDYFKISKQDNYFRISFGSKSVAVQNDEVLLKKDMSDNSLFILEKNENGSYILISKQNEELALSVNNNTLVLVEKNSDDYSQQFYFENIQNPLYIETNFEYTDDGRFLTKKIDSLGKEIKYNTDSSSGLVTEITDASGQTTNFIYNSKEQLTKITKNDRELNYEYNSNNLLSKILCGNKNYILEYDDFLKIKNFKIGENINLISKEYEDNNGKLTSTTFGNGDVIRYVYDSKNRLSAINRGDKTYNYEYDNIGNLVKISSTTELYKYYYDLSKRISKYICNGFNNFEVDYDYDVNNNIVKKQYKINELNILINYEYDRDEKTTKIIFDNNISLNNEYDYLGRIKSSVVNNNIVEYRYVTNGNKTSLMIKSMKINDDLYEYEYDDLYNITHISLNGIIQSIYEYNNFNELIADYDFDLKQTTRYKYDKYGNIVSIGKYELNTYNIKSRDIFEYNNNDWKDQLTKFNNDNITYDLVGNPLTIGNAILEWENGNRLKKYSNIDDNLTVEYEYDKDGLRIGKKVNGVQTKYLLENNNIIFENKNQNMIYYMREDDSDLIGLKYNDEVYYYIKNMQNDIIGIRDNNNNVICKYKYDAYGNIMLISDASGNEITDSQHIALINPFRYRSYYYDCEIKMYYLNNRYYNPLWGRFINADGFVGLNNDFIGYNLYSYVSNNPINNVDTDGRFLKKAWKKVKKKFKQVKKVVEKSVQKVVNVIKTVVKKVEKVVSMAKEAFVFEIQGGFGLGVKASIADKIKLSLGGDKSVGWSNKDGEYISTTVGADLLVAGAEFSIKNYDEYKNPMSFIGEMLTDDETVKSFSVHVMADFYDIGEASAELDNSGTVFIGVDLGAYVGVGCNIRIGFNIFE